MRLSQLPTAYVHPINLCNSWGSGLSDPAPLCWMWQEPWLESVINFPFLRVALSWKPSPFPLGDSDVGQNKRKLLRLNEALKVGLWFSGTSVLTRRDVRELPHLSLHPRKRRNQALICKTGRESSARTEWATTLTLAFSVSKTVGNKYLFFKLVS